MTPVTENVQNYTIIFEQEVAHKSAKELNSFVVTYFQYFQPANPQQAIAFLSYCVQYFDDDAKFNRVADMIPIHFNRILIYARQGDPDAFPHLELRNERR